MVLFYANVSSHEYDMKPNERKDNLKESLKVFERKRNLIIDKLNLKESFESFERKHNLKDNLKESFESF